MRLESAISMAEPNPAIAQDIVLIQDAVAAGKMPPFELDDDGLVLKWRDVDGPPTEYYPLFMRWSDERGIEHVGQSPQDFVEWYTARYSKGSGQFDPNRSVNHATSLRRKGRAVHRSHGSAKKSPAKSWVEGTRPVGIQVPFGRNRGREFKDITDDYLRWMIAEKVGENRDVQWWKMAEAELAARGAIKTPVVTQVPAQSITQPVAVQPVVQAPAPAAKEPECPFAPTEVSPTSALEGGQVSVVSAAAINTFSKKYQKHWESARLVDPVTGEHEGIVDFLKRAATVAFTMAPKPDKPDEHEYIGVTWLFSEYVGELTLVNVI